MIPLIFTWEVLWIVDDCVNKANIFFLRFTSPHFTSPCFTSPRFTSPRFTSPRFTSPRFTSPRFTSPVQSSPVHEIQYAVVVVQKRERNEQKSVLHVRSCFFAN